MANFLNNILFLYPYNQMKTDVLLIHPPYASDKVYGNLAKASGIFPPLGLSYLAASLEEKGYKVRINDPDADGISPDSAIKQYNPEVVGISATSPVMKQAVKIAKAAKEAGCKNVNCETDLDYLTEMFKTVSTGQKAIVRNALTLTI